MSDIDFMASATAIAKRDRESSSAIEFCRGHTIPTGPDAVTLKDVLGALEVFAFRMSQTIGDDHLPDNYEINARVPMINVRKARALLSAFTKTEPARCDECGGSGTKPFWDHERELADEEPCPGCHGTGKADETEEPK